MNTNNEKCHECEGTGFLTFRIPPNEPSFRCYVCKGTGQLSQPPAQPAADGEPPTGDAAFVESGILSRDRSPSGESLSGASDSTVSDGGAWCPLPRVPPPDLLLSMALRYDHALGCPGYYDQPIFAESGITHEMRLQGTLTRMRQIYEEVSGYGFYRWGGGWEPPIPIPGFQGTLPAPMAAGAALQQTAEPLPTTEPIEASEIGVGGVERAENSASEWDSAKGEWTFAKDIVGAFAMWACRQSPYGVPDNLEVVCKRLHEGLKTAIPWDVNGMAELSLKGIEEAIRSILYEKGVKEFDAWNERKNGREGHGFCSRYDSPEADDDSIDLDALIRNVSLTIRDERRNDRAFYERFERDQVSRAAGAGECSETIEPPVAVSETQGPVGAGGAPTSLDRLNALAKHLERRAGLWDRSGRPNPVVRAVADEIRVCIEELRLEITRL